MRVGRGGSGSCSFTLKNLLDCSIVQTFWTIRACESLINFEFKFWKLVSLSLHKNTKTDYITKEIVAVTWEKTEKLREVEWCIPTRTVPWPVNGRATIWTQSFQHPEQCPAHKAMVRMGQLWARTCFLEHYFQLFYMPVFTSYLWVPCHFKSSFRLWWDLNKNINSPCDR